MSASQQQKIKKMADEHLRTKLVAAGGTRMKLGSRGAHLQVYRSVLEGAKPKVAPAPVDPALEKERLVFEKQDGKLSKRKGDCRGKKI